MKFRTEINIEKSQHPIDHDQKVLTIGSCFAQNIGEYFEHFRFNVMCNPFGVLYNPISIYNSFNLTVQKRKFTQEDLIHSSSEWHSFFHHSDFSHHDSMVCLDKINKEIVSTLDFLSKTDIVIITYGTASVYNHIEKDIIVSNCHKIPPNEFEHFRLSLDETQLSIEQTINLLKSINENIRIIFTISPIRHWKDGAIENQLSKSTLLISVNEIVGRYDNCEYFPSYEIVMDDLRDYRFYSVDMLHPNKIATDYIWEKFSTTLLSDNCLSTMKEIEKVVKSRKHKVRNVSSESHQSFIKRQIEKISVLQKKYPHINLGDDLKYFENQLTPHHS